MKNQQHRIHDDNSTARSIVEFASVPRCLVSLAALTARAQTAAVIDPQGDVFYGERARGTGVSRHPRRVVHDL